jgi:hypothetical protein
MLPETTVQLDVFVQLPVMGVAAVQVVARGTV